MDAHGFAEALRGAVTTILTQIGVAVPKDELEIAGFKERRVNQYLRFLALSELDRPASAPLAVGSAMEASQQ